MSAAGDKLVAILHPRKQLGDSVLHAVPKRSPLISSLIPAPSDTSSHLLTRKKEQTSGLARPSSAPPQQSRLSSLQSRPSSAHRTSSLIETHSPARSIMSVAQSPKPASRSRPSTPKPYAAPSQAPSEAEAPATRPNTSQGGGSVSLIVLRHKQSAPSRVGCLSYTVSETETRSVSDLCSFDGKTLRQQADFSCQHFQSDAIANSLVAELCC
jgi:hypothetical protein